MEQKLDYEEIGLIAGLEVHQQLLTERKMFCHCPARLYTKTHDGEVLRHMRPTLSELGEYDGTALMEFKTKKNIIYLLHSSNVCTYEMDDTPPFLVNQNAMDVAIEQCLMLGCDIVDEVHIARKQYLDGSIPTGFQRTAIVGVNGKLPFRDRSLSVVQVSVEEDSCREVSDKGHLIVWRTDRLGMPLIETVTGPDLRTPEEVAEAILLIGRVCRSTGHVRVGMGASRQDVNVSVRGGRRVEIKGVPQAGWAPKLVHGEAMRQVNLLELRAELHRRGFKQPDDVKMRHEDVTSLFESSAALYLRREGWEQFIDEEERRPGFELGEGGFCVRAVLLPGMDGIFGWPTQPEHIFAHEIAGRVRVIAGLDQQPIMLSSEKWPDYEDSQRELRRLKKKLGCGPQDTVAVIWGPEGDTLMAAEEIRARLVDAIDGIPNETRQPFEDGSTDFERILPGPDRMYPDTDSPPTRITTDRVEELRRALPPPPWVREERYEAAKVPLDTIYYLIRRGGARLVDLVVEESGIDLRYACFFFGATLKGLRRQGIGVDSITDDQWLELFRLLTKQPLLRECLKELVAGLAGDPSASAAALVEAAGYGVAPEGWRDAVWQVLAQNQPLYAKGDEGRLRFYLGLVMGPLRGKVPAEEVIKIIRGAMVEGER